MSSFKSASSQEDSRGGSAFTAHGLAKIQWCVVLDTEGKACPGDDGTRVTQSEAPAAVCQALTSEEEQQDTTTAATTNVTSFGEELHLDELKEDAGIAHKTFSKNYEVLQKCFCWRVEYVSALKGQSTLFSWSHTRLAIGA